MLCFGRSFGRSEVSVAEYFASAEAESCCFVRTLVLEVSCICPQPDSSVDESISFLNEWRVKNTKPLRRIEDNISFNFLSLMEYLLSEGINISRDLKNRVSIVVSFFVSF